MSNRTIKVVVIVVISVLVIVSAIAVAITLSFNRNKSKAEKSTHALQATIEEFKSVKGYYPYYEAEIGNFDPSAASLIGRYGFFHITYKGQNCDNFSNECNNYEILMYKSYLGEDVNEVIRLSR